MFPESDLYEIERQETEQEFIDNRIKGIGGSDAAAVLGISPWMTNTQLFDIKTGAVEKPFVTNQAIEFGKSMEEWLHHIFYLTNPQYEQFDTKGICLVSKEKPFMRANIDGFMRDENGKFGLLEIKTVQGGYDKWYHGDIPQNYFAQIVHYMYVTGAEFVVVYVYFHYPFGTKNKGEINQYIFTRNQVQESMDYLVDEEAKFWDKVQKGERPTLSVSL